MVIAVYPGTFDPITNGHMDIIERGSKLFDKVILAIATSKSKAPLFDLNERIQLAEQALSAYSNIEVYGFQGLLVDFCQQHQASVVLRGLRTIADYEYELQLAGMNRHLAPEIETVFLATANENNFISSSLVKEVAILGGDISNCVPANVIAEFQKKIV